MSYLQEACFQVNSHWFPSYKNINVIRNKLILHENFVSLVNPTRQDCGNHVVTNYQWISIIFSLQLIKVNQPDLVLFVGEALVGNEAVDQLTKFNQALADHSNMTNPQLIDGIILTKFDTIDDKVIRTLS